MMDARGGLRILVDTNVWLDRYIPGRAGAEASNEFVRLAASQEHCLLYPVRILADVFFVVDRNCRAFLRASYGELSEAGAQASRGIAWTCVDNMCKVATAVGADEADVWVARAYRELHGDLEDDFVLAAAERAKADFVVTNDRALLRASTVAALTPHDMTEVLRARAVA